MKIYPFNVLKRSLWPYLMTKQKNKWEYNNLIESKITQNSISSE
jgi:hypothetical protein